jgi:hypothetical protein
VTASGDGEGDVYCEAVLDGVTAEGMTGGDREQRIVWPA